MVETITLPGLAYVNNMQLRSKAVSSAHPGHSSGEVLQSLMFVEV